MADFGFIPNLIAGENIYPFRMVKLSTTDAFTGLAATGNDDVVGVTDGSVNVFNGTYNAVEDGPISLQPTNTVQVQLGSGGATIGAPLSAGTAGTALVAGSGDLAYYLALEAGAAGDIIRAFRIGPKIV